MTEMPAEPRAVFPLVVFNRPRLGQTAGQKEGLIPKDVASILPPDKVIDFRAKVVASDVELPAQQESTVSAGDEQTGEDKDPKDPDSSVIDSATPSAEAPSPSTTPKTMALTPTENPTSLSGLPANPVDVEKEVPVTPLAPLPVKTIGGREPLVGTTGEAPKEAS